MCIFIPPFYNEWTNPDVTDAVARKLPREQAEAKHFRSDYAEYTIFRAIQQLVQDEKLDGPMVVVHSFDFDVSTSSKILQENFPSLDWNVITTAMNKEKKPESKQREFDVLLLGPNIGIVIIEAKSTGFTTRKDFNDGISFLPESFETGLKQLKDADILIFHFLNECIYKLCGARIPPECIRRVLFLPGLTDARFSRWKLTLTDKGRSSVNEKIGSVTLWTAEDMDNQAGDIGKVPLYSTMRQLLNASDPELQISREIYVSGVPVIAALKCTTLVKCGKNTMIEFNEKQLSFLQKVLDADIAIATHHPRKDKKDKQLKQNLELKPHDGLVYFLTNQQQNLLRGSNRQLIFGCGGTGKTICLQEKILSLLARGETVMIIAPKSFVGRYAALVQEYEGRCKVIDMGSFHASNEIVEKAEEGNVLS